MNTKSKNGRRQFAVRITDEQFDRLEVIALEQGFTGGSGRLEGEPNRAAALRWLLGKADPTMAANQPDPDWSRS